MFSPFGKSSDDNQDVSTDNSQVDDTEITPNEDTTLPVVDKFGDSPLNQIVSDPNTFDTRVRLQCSKCRFTFEGFNAPDICPKCGADKEYFTDI